MCSNLYSSCFKSGLVILQLEEEKKVTTTDAIPASILYFKARREAVVRYTFFVKSQHS